MQRFLFFRPLLGLFLMSFLLPACIASKSEVSHIAAIQSERPYFQELKRWYKKRRIYSELVVRSYIEVTYLSPSLQRAYLAEYADRYQLSLEEQQTLYDERFSKQNEQETFFISIFSSDEQSGELNVKDDTWKVRIFSEDENVAVAPLTVVRESADDPKTRYFYPYMEPWSRHWRVTFPKGTFTGDMLTLRMQGVIGKHDFSFKRIP